MAAHRAPNARGRAPRLFLLGRAHAAVERGAVDTEELRRLAHVAARKTQRCLDVAALPRPERLVEVEGARALELAQRLLGNRGGPLRAQRKRRRLEIELRLELGARQAL